MSRRWPRWRIRTGRSMVPPKRNRSPWRSVSESLPLHQCQCVTPPQHPADRRHPGQVSRRPTVTGTSGMRVSQLLNPGTTPARVCILQNVKVNIFPEVRREIDVPGAVEAELASRNRLLPPQWGDLALAGHEATVADWFRSLVRRDFSVQQEDILLARKLGRGARPLSLLGLQERLLYRGVVALVESTAHVSGGRSFEDYEIFQRAPLEVEGCRYVLKADIAAYYQYIDHERLVDEVVAQTGDDLAASVAVELLRQATGRCLRIASTQRLQ